MLDELHNLMLHHVLLGFLFFILLQSALSCSHLLVSLCSAQLWGFRLWPVLYYGGGGEEIEWERKWKWGKHKEKWENRSAEKKRPMKWSMRSNLSHHQIQDLQSHTYQCRRSLPAYQYLNYQMEYRSPPWTGRGWKLMNVFVDSLKGQRICKNKTIHCCIKLLLYIAKSDIITNK